MTELGALRIVYVVDGDTSVREGISRLLDSAGLEARPCASVEGFLAEVQAHHCACVLLDMSGDWERKAEVRASLHIVAGKLPVIALSSSDGPDARRRAREMGARHFFQKPVDAAALLDSIEWVAQSDRRSAPPSR